MTLKPLTTAAPVRRVNALLFALVFGLWVQILLPIEWTTARCGPGELQLPWAAYGTPFPFMMFSGVSSMEFDYVPWVLALNIAVLAAIMSIGFYRFKFLTSAWNLAWLLPTLIFGVLGLSVPLVMPVEELGYGDRVALSEFRPIGIGYGSYDCSPSMFWFQPGK